MVQGSIVFSSSWHACLTKFYWSPFIREEWQHNRVQICKWHIIFMWLPSPNVYSCSYMYQWTQKIQVQMKTKASSAMKAKWNAFTLTLLNTVSWSKTQMRSHHMFLWMQMHREHQQLTKYWAAMTSIMGNIPHHPSLWTKMMILWL